MTGHMHRADWDTERKESQRQELLTCNRLVAAAAVAAVAIVVVCLLTDAWLVDGSRVRHMMRPRGVAGRQMRDDGRQKCGVGGCGLRSQSKLRSM
jgi:hypothetical protein